MPVFWTLSKVFTLGEIFFCVSLSTTKILTNTTLGYELTMKFIDPMESRRGMDVLLMFAAVLSILLAWIADSYIGKCFISLMGIAFLITSAAVLTVTYYNFFEAKPDSYNPIIPKSLLIIYISSSMIRNVVLLEQIVIPQEMRRVRKYIYSLVMIRLTIMFLCRCIIVFHIKDVTSYMKIICIINVAMAILYFCFFFILGDKMKIEATYFRIWDLCCRCIVVAFRNKKEQEKKQKGFTKRGQQRSMSIRKLYDDEPTKKSVKFDTKLDVLEFVPGDKEPLTTTQKWGFRVIMSETPSPKHHSSHYYDKAKTVVVHHPEPIEPAKAQTFFEWVFSFLPISLQYWSEPVIEAEEEEPPPPPKQLVMHWIYAAVPNVSIYVASQTKKMYSLIFILIPASLMGNLMYFIILTSIKQRNYALESDKLSGVANVDLVTYSLAFDLILFPIYEVFIYPYVKKLRIFDLQYMAIGYAVLFFALGLCFTAQIRLETTLQYLTHPNIAHLRIFNSLPSTTVVSSTIIGYQRILRTDLYLHSFSVPQGKQSFRVRVINEESSIDRNLVFELKGGHTISYIVKFDNVLRNSDKYDPSIFSADIVNNMAYLYLVTEKILYPITVNFESKENNISTTFEYDQGKYEIIPGDYKIVIQQGTIKTYKVVDFHGSLKSSSLYALFIYVINTREVGAKFFLLEGPLSLTLERILAQLLIMSIGNAIISVSFYKFLYLESPQKLRAATFTIILALNIIGVLYVNNIVTLEEDMKYSKVILIYAFSHVLFFFLTIYFANQYQYRYTIH